VKIQEHGKGFSGRIPLDIAIEQGQSEIVERLRKHGAKE